MPARILIGADPVRVAAIREDAFVGGGGGRAAGEYKSAELTVAESKLLFFMQHDAYGRVIYIQGYNLGLVLGEGRGGWAGLIKISVKIKYTVVCSTL